MHFVEGEEEANEEVESNSGGGVERAMATAGVFLLPDYSGQVANTFDNMPSPENKAISSVQGSGDPAMSVPFGSPSVNVAMNSDVLDSEPEGTAYIPTMLWRCLDGEHPTTCTR